jgi:hypothetical protein
MVRTRLRLGFLALWVATASCTLIYGDFEVRPGTGGGAGTGGSTCSGSVSCATLQDCPDPMNECVRRTCDLGCCGTANVTAMTDAATQQPGDCKKVVCDGNGGTMTVEEDSDVPTVGDCDITGCKAGASNITHKAMLTPCSGGHCDGNGACRQCVQDSDCPGTIDDCQRPSCVNFACVPVFTAMNTPTMSSPTQIAGDCQERVCDGAGNAIDVADSTDPTSDGNECTIDTCSGPNNTTYSNAPDGITHCGSGGALSCVGGQCSGCTMNSQCAASSCNGTVFTKAQSCNVGTGTCVSPSPATQDCAPYLCSATSGCATICNVDTDCSSSSYYCTGTGGACVPKVTQGNACQANHQCATGSCTDGVCCNIACGGTCFACTNGKTGGTNGTCLPITGGTDPDSECTDQGVASCGTDGLCDGAGACRLYSSSTLCVAQSCSAGVQSNARLCDGSGTCAAGTTTNCTPYICGATACLAACTSTAQCAATFFCNPSSSKCVTPTCMDGYKDGTETDVDCGGACPAKCLTGKLCSVGGDCQSGVCLGGVCLASTCSMPSGVTDSVATAYDGFTSSVGASTTLLTSMWSAGHGGVYFVGGKMWWNEGTTDCGGWTAKTVTFIPNANGTAGSITSACETGPGAPEDPMLASGPILGMCYVGNCCAYPLYCGSLGAAPGSYAQTVALGAGSIALGAKADGFAAAYAVRGATDYPRIGRKVQLFGASMAPVLTATLPTLDEDPNGVARVNGAWWTLWEQNSAPNTLAIDPVADDGTAGTRISLGSLGSMVSVVRIVATPAGLWLGYGSNSHAYIALVAPDGTVGARRIMDTLGSGFPIAYGSATVVLASDGTKVWMLRLDCVGRQLEPPMIVATGTNVWGGALDATGKGLWVVYQVDLGGHNSQFSAVRVTLP